MTVQIYYKNSPLKNAGNLILFVGEKFDIKHLKNVITKTDYSYVDDLLKINDLKKKTFSFRA